jgi:hypothetical protein
VTDKFSKGSIIIRIATVEAGPSFCLWSCFFYEVEDLLVDMRDWTGLHQGSSKNQSKNFASKSILAVKNARALMSKVPVQTTALTRVNAFGWWGQLT